MIRNLILIIAAASLFLVSSCAGGGGGGGGSPPSSSNAYFSGSIPSEWIATTAEANVYRTSEYRAQWGLEAIHAAESYAALNKNGKAIAGSGVKIAIVDSGVVTNHPDIENNLSVSGNYNYNNVDTANITDVAGHGSNVASIAAGVKNNSVTHGVAYNATLVISDVYDHTTGDSVFVNNTDAAIIGSASVSGVRVINASFGSGSTTVDQSTIDAMAVAKNHNVLFVASAGNSGNSYPYDPAALAANSNFAGYVLAVGAVDSSSNIASFSNRCGAAKDHCLVAPGINILGADAGVDPSHYHYYAYYSGTSQAAPHVTGAAAVLFGAWPFLTAPQVSNILLTTATDLGATGVDDVYGYGMLNLYKAVQAQGSNGFTYGLSVADSHYDVRQSSFATDPIFGDAFTHNVAPALQNAIFFDDYGRDYKAFLDKKITAKGSASIISNLNGILLNNYKTNSLPLSFASNKAEGISSQLKFQVRSYANDMAAKFSNLDRSLSDKALTASNGFSFAQNINHNNRVAFAFNIDELSNSHANKFNNAGFLSVNSIASNPYQSFVGSASQNLQVASSSQKNFNQLFFEHKLFEEKLKLNFSYQASYQSASIAVGKGVRQNQIMDVNLAYNPDEKTNLMLSFGNLNEFNNNFLNSQALGAFETGGDAKTSYTKIAMSRELFKNISAIASYSEGITKADGNNLGVFRDYKNIRSRSVSFGFAAEKILGGRIGILYSEPLRVYSGKAAIDVPIARDDAGNVARYRADVSLKPQGKQQNFEMVYGRDLGQNSQLNFNFMISKDVGNVRGNNARLGMMIYKLRF